MFKSHLIFNRDENKREKPFDWRKTLDQLMKKVGYVLTNLDHTMLNVSAITVIDTIYPGVFACHYICDI